MFNLGPSEILIIVVVLLFRILVVAAVVGLVVLVVKSLLRQSRPSAPTPPTALTEDRYREPDGYVRGHDTMTRAPDSPPQADPPQHR